MKDSMINCFKDFACLHSCAQLFEILWTIAHKDPPSMEFSRQEYWSGLPFPSLGDLSDPGIKPASLGSPVLAGRFLTTQPPGNGEGNGNPLQYSCLANPMDGGAW